MFIILDTDKFNVNSATDCYTAVHNAKVIDVGLVVRDNKIIAATEKEFYNYWLKNMSDIFDFEEYKRECINLGMEIM